MGKGPASVGGLSIFGTVVTAKRIRTESAFLGNVATTTSNEWLFLRQPLDRSPGRVIALSVTAPAMRALSRLGSPTPPSAIRRVAVFCLG
jgi:hypothetical protein